jgi:hypothetical protein
MSASWFFSGVSAGTQVTRVRLVNHSSRTCTLVGQPVALTGVRPDGQLVSLNGGGRIGPGSAYVGAEPAVLDPHGGAADLALITNSAQQCVSHPPLPAITALRIQLPTGTVTAPWDPDTDAGATFSFPCPPTATSFALWTNPPAVEPAQMPGSTRASQPRREVVP